MPKVAPYHTNSLEYSQGHRNTVWDTKLAAIAEPLTYCHLTQDVLTTKSVGIGLSVGEHSSRYLLDQRTRDGVARRPYRYPHAVGPSDAIRAGLDIERQRNSVNAVRTVDLFDGRE
jgi:hypothetical protein